MDRLLEMLTNKKRKRQSKLALLLDEYSFEVSSLSCRSFWHQAELLRLRYKGFDRYTMAEVTEALMHFYHADSSVQFGIRDAA